MEAGKSIKTLKLVYYVIGIMMNIRVGYRFLLPIR